MVATIEPAGRTTPKTTAKEVLDACREQAVRFISLQFSDVMGMVKNVTIPVEIFPQVIEEGQWFDGSSIAGFARIAESDMFLMPDLDTFRVLPWDDSQHRTARVICWVHKPDGDLFPGDPRAVLLRQLDRAAALGYVFNTGPEPEFFLFEMENKKIAFLPHDRGSYFDLSTDLADTARKDMVNALQAMGIKVEASHHEVAPGQHEIDFEYDHALSGADQVMTFKYTLKAIAQAHGLHATFMPKPVAGISGSGMHVHQSLAFIDGGENAFVDQDDTYGLSTQARQFLAGQLAHARGMCAVMAPIVNSYRRLVPGYEAPVYVSWARQNRSALIRVPSIRSGKTSATRLELRCPDPSCNPYLAYAVMLAAGLDGIEQGLELPEPVEENLYQFSDADLARRNVQTLPTTLGEAMTEMAADSVVRDALGEHVFERLTEAQNKEWQAFRLHVTEWERDRYIEHY